MSLSYPSRAFFLAIALFWGIPNSSAQSKNTDFNLAKDAFAKEKYNEAAELCWRFMAKASPSADKYESAQFFLASSLEKLGFYHAAVELFFQVANNRRTPKLLPRAIKALEHISLQRPIDEGLILRDLLGSTDFGDLPLELTDFVHYWQGLTNLRRGLHRWANERFAAIDRKGYYYYSALYVASIRLLTPAKKTSKVLAVESFASLFGPLDLSAALESLRRRGESDSKLAYALKALLNQDNQIAVDFDRLPEGWEIELALLGLARISAETEILLERANETDEEELGRLFSYQVQIGGIPIYRRTPHFENRGPLIKAVATRRNAVGKIRGQALHAEARLLYEQKRYAAAYEILGQIPKRTELGSEILLERAWAKYKAGDPHRAMGLLYALDAPIYRNLFAPERYVLRGLIYRHFCHFRAAKLAARRFTLEYDNALSAIRDGKSPTEIPSIRKAALRRAETHGLFLFNRTLESERKGLETSDAWKTPALKNYLLKLYDHKLRQINSDLERNLEITSREVANEMLKTEEQVNLLEYEVGQAIFQRVGEAVDMAKVRKRKAKVPISSNRAYYRFGGEYWTDELPFYKFNIEDRCVK
ncbi:MAG: hypothetical protein V1754_04330 [Pseudomonadota bacterium]